MGLLPSPDPTSAAADADASRTMTPCMEVEDGKARLEAADPISHQNPMPADDEEEGQGWPMQSRGAATGRPKTKRPTNDDGSGGATSRSDGTAQDANADVDEHDLSDAMPASKRMRLDAVNGTMNVQEQPIHTMPIQHATVKRVYSPLDVATAAQIRQHMQDVRRERFARPLIAIVTRLMFHKYNRGMFNERVDPVAWNIPHYLEIVKHPMDLTLVKTKCLNLEYASADDCAQEIRLVFQNACLFNPPGHVVHECAKLLQQEFEAEYARYLSKCEAQQKRRDDHTCASCLANTCGVCKEKCINLEPPLVMCSGPCNQRIKRHAVYYYCARDQDHQWCAKCYSALPKVVTLDNTASAQDLTLTAGSEGAVIIAKHELIKTKFVDELTEPWVQCDKCDGWVHQICALFNACENSDGEDDLPYVCPLCRLMELEGSDEPKDSASVCTETSVEDYPVQLHSESLSLIGSHSPILKQRLAAKDFTRVLGFDVENEIQDQGSCVEEQDDGEEQGNVETDRRGNVTSSQLKGCALSRFMQEWVQDHLNDMGETEVGNSITIKVASSIKTSCTVSPVAREHVKSARHEYPESMEYVSKAICVFQKIQGAEVCVFSMYVQEYGNDSVIVANRNRAYIAYIDSLVYMRPRHLRTSIFHEIIIAYLAFCKVQGFKYAHIWACPTTRGGDFIYWCHPPFQKNPDKDRLLRWYTSMISKAKKSGVVFASGDLFAHEFATLEDTLEKNQLPPYFDGDYWPSEIERLQKNPPKRGKMSKQAHEATLHGAKFRHRLVESIRSARESLFVLALQPQCANCQAMIVNGSCWDGSQGLNERRLLCDACRPPADSSELVEVKPPEFVKRYSLQSREPEIQCSFLDHRSDMLQHCEEKHYQFDSFRRAKYSTMMLVYHIFSTQRVLE